MANIKLYESENELGFIISLSQYWKALKTSDTGGVSILQVLGSDGIVQKWIFESIKDGCKIRSRIRHINNDFGDESYEYTTKYYWDTGARYELNAPCSKEEYTKIDKLFGDIDSEKKIRIYLRDTETSLIYTADIYKDDETKKDVVRIEIEFRDSRGNTDGGVVKSEMIKSGTIFNIKNNIKKSDWKAPRWLTGAIGKDETKM